MKYVLFILQCNVVLSDGKIHSLIFGGQFDGDIALLHSTQSIFTMPLPCPAHDSRVTMLVGASDLVTNMPASSASGKVVTQSALISYGKISDRLHVWGVQLDEEQFTLGLQLLLVVKMTTRPHHISLISSTACLAMENSQIIMFRTPFGSVKIHPMDIVSIGSIMLEEHMEEEDHTHDITSLNACPYLQLFVSSSKDGTIKVWSFDNQLVTEINFGVPLSAVGFANTQGDLLVALQLQISIVRAVDYLPPQYCELSTSCPHWDHKERPVAFDPQLEFWLALLFDHVTVFRFMRKVPTQGRKYSSPFPLV